MKRYILLTVIISVALCALLGCKNDATSGTVELQNCEIALITDEGTIEDGANNQAAYEGVKKYGEDNSIATAYFTPNEISKESYLNEIKNAVKSGAKVVVCPGYLLEEAVFDAQTTYTDTKFILVNGEPHNDDYSDMTIADNTSSIKFSEEDAGFIAGYAAVREGYRYIGFMGGMPEDSVIRYGYGFVQGADYAAIELGVKIYIAYVYANTFTEDIHVKNMAGNWYENGMEVIFSCGGSMNRSVISAAEEHNKEVIIAESDKIPTSAAILFSCSNNVADAVYNSIDSVYKETFIGGQVNRLSLKDNYVGIDMDTAKFKNFSDVEYEAVCTLLKNNEINPYDNTEIANTKELNLVNTQIVYAEYEEY